MRIQKLDLRREYKTMICMKELVTVDIDRADTKHQEV